MADRTYSEKEFALILKKAAKLGDAPATTPDSRPELTLEEMKAIGAEAGLDPALIERAAQYLPQVKQTSLGGWGALKLSASLPVALTREQAEHVLSVLRAATGHPGVGEATSSGLTWRGAGFSGPLVTVHREGQNSRVQISAKPAQVLAFAVPLGIVAAFLLPAMLDPIAMGDVFAGVAAGLAIVTTCWVSVRRKTTKAVRSVVEAVGDAMLQIRDTEEAS